MKKAGLNNDFIDIMVGHKPDDVSVQNCADYSLAIDEAKEEIERMVLLYYPALQPRHSD